MEGGKGMNFFRAFIGIGVTVGLAFLLGWTRHVKHPVLNLYSWLGAILLLLAIRFYL